jgi:hypothetical protein
MMDLLTFLIEGRNEILEQAVVHLSSCHAKSYDTSDKKENKERLAKLFDLTIESVKAKSLTHIKLFAADIAKERFESGFDLSEVITAFNALEEQIWKKILNSYQDSDLGKALGYISTILGAGKESLALTYVSLASKKRVATLDLSALFQ